MKKITLLLALILTSNVSFALGFKTEAKTIIHSIDETAITQTAVKVSTDQIFNDVTEENPFFKGIELLAKNNIINGYKDGSFKPENKINRAEMLKIIISSAILNNDPFTDINSFSGQNCFEDVEAGQWYAKYVCYAKSNGWVVGYEDGKYFKPNQSVTFVEGLKITLSVFGTEFTENNEPWYKNIVNIASEEQLIPYTINAFDKELNRGEMSDMIGRFISKQNGSLAEYLGDKINVSHTFESIENGTEAPVFVSKIDKVDEKEGMNEDGNTNTDIISEDKNSKTTSEDVDTNTENNKDTETTIAKIDDFEKWATFESLPYEFSCTYPELWYYFGSSMPEDETIVHHYGFSNVPSTNEDGSVNESYSDIVSIDIMAATEVASGTTIATSGKELTMSQADGIFTIFLKMNDKLFRVSGPVEYKNTVLIITKSIEKIVIDTPDGTTNKTTLTTDNTIAK